MHNPGVGSNARIVYDTLRRDVKTLLALHPRVHSPGPGRPRGDTGPLLRSTVVLIHTAWENYFEQVVVEAATAAHLAIGQDHDRLPKGTRQALGNRKDPWSLAGDRWKAAATEFVDGKVAALNTPNASNVESIADDCLGLPRFLEGCSWQGKSADAVRADLDALVHEVRGEIVHKGRTASPLYLVGVKSWDGFVSKLVDKTDGVIADHIDAEFGVRPWL